MHTYHHGRHEHGQNFLNDHRTITQIIHLVRATDGPILEIGAGSGSLTERLVTLGRPVTAIEIDQRLAAGLEERLGRRATVVNQDFLTYRLPAHPHVIVGNLPFHLTTAILRRLLHAPGWTDAILLVQWEVARRRAGVGASTMMTAQWAPWFTFALHGRVPARAFTPMPGVDGGLITIRRNLEPAIPAQERRAFQGLVHRVFTGKGRGLGEILRHTTSVGSKEQVARWLGSYGLGAHALPRDLPAKAWIDLYATSGTSPPTGRTLPARRPGRQVRRGRRG